MTSPAPDHTSIRQTEDRSWSLPLLHAFVKSTADDDIEDLIGTLQVLDDYRILSPLTSILEDRSAKPNLREGASEILSGCTTAESANERRNWWNSQDPILMRHAILVAERSEMDIIEEVANNPQHPFYADAIEKLGVRFEEPRFQLLKIRALSDSRANVRACAASAILWDQPISAEAGLLRLAQEDDDEAAAEALDALAYYDSQSALISIHEMLKTGPIARRERYAEVFEDVRDDFLSAFKRLRGTNASAATIFKAWLSPVWETLALTDADFSPEQTTENESAKARSRKPERFTTTIDEVMERFDNADGMWSDRWNYIGSIDWSSFSSEERLLIIKYFSQHADWSVREVSCSALGRLRASDALLGFLHDEVFAVRKMAAYYIREVPTEHRIAKHLWEMLIGAKIAGVNATETLESYVVHSSDADIDERLCDLAKTDQRESVKYTAIGQLKKREARQHVESLLPILDDEPLITWSAHQYLLSACLDLQIPVPQAERLAGIDDLHLQESLAMHLAKRDAI
ncbi:hypothetical protein KF728_04955 [Candidatus Obscuribacterales bacterium]|nr:hypothetical protein [Candidatus Obscuribacterales bacterium]